MIVIGVIEVNVVVMVKVGDVMFFVVVDGNGIFIVLILV